MMKSLDRMRLVPGLWMALVLGLLLSLPVYAADNKLSGTWEVAGTPDTPAVDPFVNLSWISPDGGIVNVDPSEGAAVGDWQYLGAGQYTVTFHGFLPGGARFKVEGLVRMADGGSQFVGPFVTQVMDPVGNVVFEFGGEVVGTRL